jgi:hypothetical protein
MIARSRAVKGSGWGPHEVQTRPLHRSRWPGFARGRWRHLAPTHARDETRWLHRCDVCRSIFHRFERGRRIHEAGTVAPASATAKDAAAVTRRPSTSCASSTNRVEAAVSPKRVAVCRHNTSRASSPCVRAYFDALPTVAIAVVMASGAAAAEAVARSQSASRNRNDGILGVLCR